MLLVADVLLHFDSVRSESDGCHEDGKRGGLLHATPQVCKEHMPSLGGMDVAPCQQCSSQMPVLVPRWALQHGVHLHDLQQARDTGEPHIHVILKNGHIYAGPKDNVVAGRGRAFLRLLCKAIQLRQQVASHRRSPHVELNDVELLLGIGDGPSGGALAGYYTWSSASHVTDVFKQGWLRAYPHLSKLFSLGTGFIVPDYHFGSTCQERQAQGEQHWDAVSIGSISCDDDDYSNMEKQNRSAELIISETAFWRGSPTGAGYNEAGLLELWQSATNGDRTLEVSPLWIRLVLHKLSQVYPSLLDAEVGNMDSGQGLASIGPTLRHWLGPIGARARALSLLQHRYLVDVTGNGWSSSLTKRMHSNRTILKRADGLIEWFYPKVLSEHAICWVAPDVSDLVPTIRQLQARTCETTALARRALGVATRHLTFEHAAHYLSDWLQVYSALLRFNVSSPVEPGMSLVQCQA